MKVCKGQLWEISSSHGRVQVRIERVTKDEAFGRTPNNRLITLARSVLEHGKRASRLVESAPGVWVDPGRVSVMAERVSSFRMTKEEQKTASDYRRTTAPRCLVKAKDVDEEALGLREREGLSIKAIAKRQGVSESTVNGRLTRAREAREDQALLRAMGGT